MNRKLASFRTYAKSIGIPNLLEDYSAPKVGKRHPHPLPEGITGVARMIEVAKTNDEKAIAVLCGMVSLRISEAREVRPSHFDLTRGYPVLKIRGKGDKSRMVPIGNEAWDILFPMVTSLGPGDVKLVLLSDSAARRAWTRLGQRAELGRRTSSHDGRATCATHLDNRGASIRTIQEILGHASVATTEVYVGVSMENMKEAMNF